MPTALPGSKTPHRPATSHAPKVGLHKASGKARIKVGGRSFYLRAAFGTAEADGERDRIYALWLSNGRAWPPRQQPSSGLLVAELCVAYRQAMKQELSEITIANTLDRLIDILNEVSAAVPVQDFSLQHIRQIRERLLNPIVPGRRANCPRTINQRIIRIRTIFRWGVAEGLVPAAVLGTLKAVRPLRRGNLAPNPSSVTSVADSDVEQTLPKLSSVVADMVRLQRLTGMRPGEVCGITWGEIRRCEHHWIYRPAHHKTAHINEIREIALGPLAIEVLQRYTHRPRSKAIFSPHEVCRATGGRVRASAELEQYTVSAYRRAIARACVRAQTQIWSPNQLRHTFATQTTERLGVEAASAAMGHKRLKTTEVYLDRNRTLALQVAKQLG